MTRAKRRAGPGQGASGSASRRLGRPPRIDAGAIAHAALEIGLERVTMRRVAEQLGVRAATLYHHVRSKQDLLRLAGERSMRSMALPPDRGQHWAAWLEAYGRAGRNILLARPELLEQIATGALGLDQVVDAIEVTLAVLTRQGFSAHEAIEAFVSISQCAIGAAIHERRERRSREAMDPLRDELLQAIALRRPEELANVRRLLRTEWATVDYERLFERQMSLLLIGLAATRGEDWRPFLPTSQG